MHTHFLRRLCTIAILFVLLLSGCSASKARQNSPHYVGKVDGTDAFIGFVISGTQIVAYVCDGNSENINMYAWFKGEVAENTFTLSTDQMTLTGTSASNKVSGTLQLADGSQHAFNADKVDSPAGVFRQEETENGATMVTGWIVLSNQEYRGGKFSSIIGGPPAIVGGPPAIISRLDITIP